MGKTVMLAPIALLMSGVSSPAMAQSISKEEADALRQQVAILKAQVEALESRLDKQETAQEATAAALAAAPKTVAPAPAADNIKVSWKGAPEISTSNGWSFKPRGRMQFDAGDVRGPQGFVNASQGFSSELRRLYIGAQGTIPGGFSYLIDLDFAPANTEITDAFLAYKDKALTVTVGQFKPFWSIDELTSDLNISLMERAAFTQAFGFERRVGISAAYAKGDVSVSAGAFTDNIADLQNDHDNSYSIDGRVVWAPEFDGNQLHLAASAHWRKLNDLSGTDMRYRARPGVHSTDLRYISTPFFRAEHETGYGLEAGWFNGGVHVLGEAYWQNADVVGASNAHFFGGYAEAGVFLTRGDNRNYGKGSFGSVKPKSGLDAGGIGAIELVVRYDRLDLNGGSVNGGTEDSGYVGVSWWPVEHLRFMLNYGHLEFRNVLVTANGDRDFGADTFAARAQIDF